MKQWLRTDWIDTLCIVPIDQSFGLSCVASISYMYIFFSFCLFVYMLPVYFRLYIESMCPSVISLLSWNLNRKNITKVSTNHPPLIAYCGVYSMCEHIFDVLGLSQVVTVLKK